MDTTLTMYMNPKASTANRIDCEDVTADATL